MTSMQQPQPNEQRPGEPGLFGINLLDMEASSPAPHTVSFGSRLHAAREAQGLDLEACAHALKLPARVLRQLERDHYDGADSRIYLASYIRKYGRHLGINEASIQVELDRIKQIETPLLVATGGISHSRFLLDRYATAATYVVLTAVIVVPMIWLGVRGTLDRDLSHLAPLDAAPVAQLEASATHVAAADAHAGTPVPQAPPKAPPPQEADQPLLASMAPFPNLESANLSPARLATPAASSSSGTGDHSLSLSLSAASWVEVTQADGTRLEYGLLAAGSSRTWHSDQPLDVRIGNASGAQVSIDGKSIGLGEFRRANVARFRLQMQDGKAAAIGF